MIFYIRRNLPSVASGYHTSSYFCPTDGITCSSITLIYTYTRPDGVISQKNNLHSNRRNIFKCHTFVVFENEGLMQIYGSWENEPSAFIEVINLTIYICEMPCENIRSPLYPVLFSHFKQMPELYSWLGHEYFLPWSRSNSVIFGITLNSSYFGIMISSLRKS